MEASDGCSVPAEASQRGPITLQRLKYGAIPHYRHIGTILGADQTGTWVSVPPQPLTRNGEHILDVSWWTLQLIPSSDEGWWAAFFEDGVGSYDTYVDICVESHWAGATASMIDLDLDVVRHRVDRSVAVIDHDDLERHADELCYPAELVDFALATAERLREALAGAVAPFDESAEPWMERLRARRRARHHERSSRPTWQG